MPTYSSRVALSCRVDSILRAAADRLPLLVLMGDHHMSLFGVGRLCLGHRESSRQQGRAREPGHCLGDSHLHLNHLGRQWTRALPLHPWPYRGASCHKPSAIRHDAPAAAEDRASADVGTRGTPACQRWSTWQHKACRGCGCTRAESVVAWSPCKLGTFDWQCRGFSCQMALCWGRLTLWALRSRLGEVVLAAGWMRWVCRRDGRSTRRLAWRRQA